MRLLFTREAVSNLRSLDTSVQTRVLKKLEWIAAQKNPFVFIKALTGYRDIYSVRIGQYRVLVSPDGVILTVLRIGPRDKIYRS